MKNGLIILGVLTALPAVAQIQLVGDLNTAPGDSNPRAFSSNGALTYFVADDPRSGSQPFRTDGTAAGTFRLRDSTALNQGGPFSSNLQLATAGTTTFVATRFSLTGVELGMSDGSVAGTVLIKDIRPGTASSSPLNFTPAGARLFFTATDATSGRELWVSDGTTNGTVRVRDLRAGTASPGIQELTAVGANVFFTADDGINGRHLWFSDGTQGGTVRLTSGTPAFGERVALGNLLLFALDDGTSGMELWKSDGTPGGTVQVADLGPSTSSGFPNGFAVMGGFAYFQACDDDLSADLELWKSDGTALGTSRVIDLEAGPAGSAPVMLRAAGSTLYFFATTNSDGLALWRSNGTSTGTTLVRALGAGSTVSEPALTIGSQLYFHHTDAPTGTELWTSDGTLAGTRLVRDLFPGPISGALGTSLGVLGTRALFAGNDGANGSELWLTDGTSAGTVLVRDVFSGTGNANPFYVTKGLSGVVFQAYDPASDVELWRTSPDGGLAQIYDVYPGPSSGAIEPITTVGGQVFFGGAEEDAGYELWVTDGTTAGTHLVEDLFPGPDSSQPVEMVALGDRLIFVAEDGTAGFELFSSQGSAATTGLLKDICPGPNSSIPQFFLVVGSTVYFEADDCTVGTALWKSDGTPAGTVLVKHINPAGDSSIRFVAALGSTVFFLANDGTNGSELWKTDGTLAGTVLVKDINPGPGGVVYRRSVGLETRAILGSTLFMELDDGSTGFELWKTDGTSSGTLQVKDLNPGAASSSPSSMATLGNRIIFSALEPSVGVELFITDGTTAGTMLLRDLNPGAGHGGASGFAPYSSATGPRLFFNGNDGSSGAEPWSTDGTAAGTHRLADLAVGPEASFPFFVVPDGNTIYFSAYGTGVGVELFRFLPDFSPPSISAQPTGTLGTNGWYTSNVTVAFTVTDAQSPVGSCAPTTIAADTASTPVACTVSSEGGSSSASITIKRDATAPVLTCPASAVSVEATMELGGRATFAVSATDALDPAPVVLVSPPSGTIFPLGFTAVNGTATDHAGNQSTCPFSVQVSDTTAPAVSCPASATHEATSSAGATVTFVDATATDAVDRTPTLGYSRASGSVFPLGPTTVTATATDDASNAGSCTFLITVRDSTAPAVSCPANFATTAMAANTVVTYPPATATDAVDTMLALTYSKGSGSSFPAGETSVTATATDDAGNTASCSFTVTLTDETPPLLVCPSTVTVEATAATGAPVSFSPAQAIDSVDPAPALTYSQAAGSVFPLGRSTVTATATDASGNARLCTFEVVVQDTTPPLVTCPARVVVDSADGKPLVVDYPAATAEDLVDPAPRLTYSIPAGSEFEVGSTLVTATARDVGGRTDACTFQVTVRAPEPEASGCGCGAGSGPLALMAACLLALRSRRRCRAKLHHLK